MCPVYLSNGLKVRNDGFLFFIDINKLLFFCLFNECL
ncbi:hypothetical protein EcHS_A2175 [Escherichia coli HS]|nr:hypothetical protein EcHS_A2175 [Escherichia coli HS]